ncbi:MAG: ABC transporter permease [Planctomycetes bacterium]|nr:ABC transporter permease [Planctomycetota bacterium]
MLWIRQVLALGVKEFLTILKDPKSRFVVIGPPLIQFFVFGYAATFEVTRVPYAVMDEDRSSESRDLLARFSGSMDFSLVAEFDDPRAMERSVDVMESRLVLHVETGFAEHLRTGRPAELQVILDGRNSNVSGIALGYVQGIVSQWSRAHATSRAGPAIELVQRAWFNPSLDSHWFIISGLPAQIALVVVLLLTSLSVAREREQGTFDQTLVAPIDSLQILVGKAMPPFVLGLFDGMLLSAGAVYWFGVPMAGSIPALVALLAVYACAVLGIGLFVSSLATTMQQGLLGAFMVMMPAVLLSGFTTPIENMPAWLQSATIVNPARYAVAGCRAVFLEGADLTAVAPYLLPMGLVAVLMLAASGWLFRHRSR